MLKKCLILGLALQAFVVPAVYAEDAKPKFECTLSDTVKDDSIGEAKDSFGKETAKIYLYCDSSDVKKGQAIKGDWVAVDTNNAAPANYKIDEATVTVSDDLTAGQTYDAKFSLSKPTAGWPLGHYQTNVYIDGQLDQSVKFDIK